MSTPARRVVLVCRDRVGEMMAGPAIRAVELTRVLAEAGFDAVLAAPEGSSGSEVTTLTWADEAGLRAIVAGADVVVAFAPIIAEHRWLGGTGAVLIADAYDPGLLESLIRLRGEPVNAQRDQLRIDDAEMVGAIVGSDAMLVASERQRHFMLGAAAASGRLGPRTIAEDPTLERFVRVVPFGVPDRAPEPVGRPLRRPDGPFAADAFVAYWGGGLYPWLDPLTLVEAIARTDDERVCAAFLAGPHPTPVVGPMPLVDVARARVTELGLERRIAFVEHWVPYAQRADWACSADVGVSLHRDHVETEFSYRTRVVDYLWCGLPVLCSRGDVLAEEVDSHGLGHVVTPGSVDEVAAALDSLARAGEEERSDRRARAARWAAEHTWRSMAEPLIDACATTSVAPERRTPAGQSVGLRARFRKALTRG